MLQFSLRPIHGSVPGLLVALVGTLAASPALGQVLDSGDTLVENLNTEPSSAVLERDGNPRDFQAVGSELLFSAEHNSLGRELWATDGTTAGTRPIFDFDPGFDPSGDDGLPREFAYSSPDVLLFAATDPAHGGELWRTDGTPEGTVLVSDLLPGPESSNPFQLRSSGGFVYFLAGDTGGELRLWRSDGTTAGTVQIDDFEVGGQPTLRSTFSGEELAAGPSGLYCLTFDGQTWSIWFSTGAVDAASVLVTETLSGALIGPDDLTIFGGALYFSAPWNGAAGWLWRSDGTVGGTAPFFDPSDATGDPLATQLTVVNGELFFLARPTLGARELYKTDGTLAGTVQVTFYPNPSPGNTGTGAAIVGVDGGLIFLQMKLQDPNQELYVTDGTPGNVTLFQEFQPGPFGSAVGEVVPFGSGYLVGASTFSAGSQLWFTDGTPSSLVQLTAVFPGGAHFLTPLGDEVLFALDREPEGEELWATDGTPGGTRLLKNLNTSPDGGSFPSQLRRLGDRLFLSADDGTSGDEPYVSDGTAAGTLQLADLNPGGSPSVPVGRAFRGRMFFSALTSATGIEIYVSDGTPGGTQLLLDGIPGPGSLAPEWIGEHVGELYFSGRPSGGGFDRSLFTTDGTAAGTRFVANLDPPGDMDPKLLVSHTDGLAYFIGSAQGVGRELCVTDGTTAGTAAVADLFPGPLDGIPTDFSASDELVSFADRLFFAGRASVAEGRELFVSDGTDAGTQLFADLDPSGEGDPEDLTVVGDRLLFLAETATQGRQLFAIEEQTLGLTQLSAVDTGPSFSDTVPDGIDGTLWKAGERAFVLFDEVDVGNQRLLVTDGTPGGTSVLTTIDPSGVYPVLSSNHYGTSDGRILFAAHDGKSGYEVWTSDGTTEGTRQLTEIHLLGASSGPFEFTRVGSRVFFRATDEFVGPELHSLPLSTTGGWVVEPWGNGCGGVNGPPTLGYSGEARLGKTLTLELGNTAPFSSAFLFLGLGSDLVDVNTLCSILVAAPTLALTLPTDASGNLSLPVGIPNVPLLTSLPVWAQFLVVDPGGPINGIASLTPALEAVVGP